MSADEGLLSDEDEEELPVGEKEQKEKEEKEKEKEKAKAEKNDADDQVQMIVEDKRRRMRDDAKAALYKERKDSAAALKVGVFLYALPVDDAKTQVRLQCDLWLFFFFFFWGGGRSKQYAGVAKGVCSCTARERTHQVYDHFSLCSPSLTYIVDAPPAEPLPPKQPKLKPVSEEALVLFAKFIHGTQLDDR